MNYNELVTAIISGQVAKTYRKKETLGSRYKADDMLNRETGVRLSTALHRVKTGGCPIGAGPVAGPSETRNVLLCIMSAFI